MIPTSCGDSGAFTACLLGPKGGFLLKNCFYYIFKNVFGVHMCVCGIWGCSVLAHVEGKLKFRVRSLLLPSCLVADVLYQLGHLMGLFPFHSKAVCSGDDTGEVAGS